MRMFNLPEGFFTIQRVLNAMALTEILVIEKTIWIKENKLVYTWRWLLVHRTCHSLWGAIYNTYDGTLVGASWSFEKGQLNYSWASQPIGGRHCEWGIYVRWICGSFSQNGSSQQHETGLTQLTHPGRERQERESVKLPAFHLQFIGTPRSSSTRKTTTPSIDKHRSTNKSLNPAWWSNLYPLHLH